jgi:hypothetical protein
MKIQSNFKDITSNCTFKWTTGDIRSSKFNCDEIISRCCWCECYTITLKIVELLIVDNSMYEIYLQRLLYNQVVLWMVHQRLQLMHRHQHSLYQLKSHMVVLKKSTNIIQNKFSILFYQFLLELNQNLMQILGQDPHLSGQQQHEMVSLVYLVH